MDVDVSRAQRESLRWTIILVLDKARPIGANEALVHAAITDTKQPVTAHEVRRELDYLASRELVKLDKDGPVWHAELTRYGIDLAEYTIDCEPGIARPKKYW